MSIIIKIIIILTKIIIKLALIIAVNLQFKRCLWAWKIQGFNGVRTHDLAIPVRRSNQLRTPLKPWTWSPEPMPSWVRTPLKPWIFPAHNQLLKLLFTAIIKANLTFVCSSCIWFLSYAISISTIIIWGRLKQKARWFLKSKPPAITWIICKMD